MWNSYTSVHSFTVYSNQVFKNNVGIPHWCIKYLVNLWEVGTGRAIVNSEIKWKSSFSEDSTCFHHSVISKTNLSLANWCVHLRNYVLLRKSEQVVLINLSSVVCTVSSTLMKSNQVKWSWLGGEPLSVKPGPHFQKVHLLRRLADFHRVERKPLWLLIPLLWYGHFNEHP